MKFSVTFSGTNNGTVDYDGDATFEVLGGALAITESSGRRVIWAPAMWVQVEVESGEDPSYIRLPR